MKKFLTLIIVVVVLLAVWVIGSPYWTLYQLKQAYDAKDTATINDYVDYPRVRQDIKAQLSPIIVEKATRITQSPILQALNIQMDGTAMVDKLVNQAVDNTITPDGVTNLITEQTAPDHNAQLLSGLMVVAMGKLNILDLISANNQTELQQKIRQQLLASTNQTATNSEPKANYCGFNCFKVDGQVRGYPLTVTLERQDLTNWQIVGFTLPLNQ